MGSSQRAAREAAENAAIRTELFQLCVAMETKPANDRFSARPCRSSLSQAQCFEEGKGKHTMDILKVMCRMHLQVE